MIEPSKEDNNIDNNIDQDSNMNNKINDTSVGKNQFINKKRRGTQTTIYSLRNYEKKESENTSYKYYLRK